MLKIKLYIKIDWTFIYFIQIFDFDTFYGKNINYSVHNLRIIYFIIR